MKTNYILAVLAILGGISAAFTNHSRHNDMYPDWNFRTEQVDGKRVRFISAPHLADLIYSKKENILIFDGREWNAYEKYHIPRALPLDTGPGAMKGVQGTTVIYGSEENSDLVRKADELPGRVYLLKGGMESWYSLVLFPDFARDHIRNGDQLDYILRRSLFFGGQPRNTQLLNIDERERRYREGC